MRHWKVAHMRCNFSKPTPGELESASFSSDQDRCAVVVMSQTYLILRQRDCWSLMPMHYKFLADVPACSRFKTRSYQRLRVHPT